MKTSFPIKTGPAKRNPKPRPSEVVVQNASRSRRDRDRKELRESILREAGALFVELGYDGFSMRKVAARIGYSVTTIYHHFKDKDALLMALLGEAFCSFGQSLDAAGARESDPVERVVATGKAYVRFARENPVFFHLMFLRRPDYLVRREQEALKDAHDGYSALLRDAEGLQAAGFYRGHAPEAVASALWASVHGLAMLSLTVFKEDPAVIDDVAKVLFQLDPRLARQDDGTGRENGKSAEMGDTSPRARCSKGNNDKKRNGEPL